MGERSGFLPLRLYDNRYDRRSDDLYGKNMSSIGVARPLAECSRRLIRTYARLLTPTQDVQTVLGEKVPDANTASCCELAIARE